MMSTDRTPQSGLPGALFDLAGRKVVVTGAASGLGRIFAEALSQSGAAVAWVDREVEALAACEAVGVCDCRVVADLGDEAGVSQMAEKVLAWCGGKLDVLINNAGIATRPGRLLDVQAKDWDRVFAINLRGAFLVTQALLPALIQSGRGSVVNISSYLGTVGVYPGFPVTAIPYAASKAGLIGFTRQLAIEYAAEQVRSNAIAPGWHSGTRLGRERDTTGGAAAVAQMDAFVEREVPLGYRGRPADLVGLVIYLASDASSYVTGQVFVHDGGITAR
ncbi:SDR family NAD(P)-dependent oxidoreductase [Paraburkholderia sp. 32]|uniref:SDR family NAD(P)-dependent oxidoreductase n=1 Tax=Paraburkholderia sp. 32 TaxID=2991057 RepID=UPI003D1AAD02